MSEQIKRALRPKPAAARAGVSLATFYRLAKRDPAFPKFIKLGERVTLVDAAELDAWLESKKVAA